MAPKFSLYTSELAEVILERLADGEPLRAICRDEGMPTEGAVRWWATTDHEGFAARYARAREAGAAALAEDLLEIADDGRNDTYIGDDGEERTNHEVVTRSRLRVDTRKWLLSKLLPKTYGDKIDLNHSGQVALQDISDEQLESRLAHLLGASRAAVAPGGEGAEGE